MEGWQSFADLISASKFELNLHWDFATNTAKCRCVIIGDYNLSNTSHYIMITTKRNDATLMWWSGGATFAEAANDFVPPVEIIDYANFLFESKKE